MRTSILVPMVIGCSLMLLAACSPPSAVNHPVLGTWTMTSKDGACSETYRFRPDGTVFVTSGDEVAEIRYEISASPGRSGFYRWTHKIEKDNGKSDCSGKVMKPGDGATWYIQFDQSQQRMIVCNAESTNACFGPLQRTHGSDS